LSLECSTQIVMSHSLLPSSSLSIHVSFKKEPVGKWLTLYYLQFMLMEASAWISYKTNGAQYMMLLPY
jgi:hypothetical protein